MESLKMTRECLSMPPMRVVRVAIVGDNVLEELNVAGK